MTPTRRFSSRRPRRHHFQRWSAGTRCIAKTTGACSKRCLMAIRTYALARKDFIGSGYALNRVDPNRSPTRGVVKVLRDALAGQL